YTFSVDWVAGKTHQIADALSRSPVFDPFGSKSDDIEISVSTISVNHDQALGKLVEIANTDPVYQSIKLAIQSGYLPGSLPQSHPAKLFSKKSPYNSWHKNSHSSFLPSFDPEGTSSFSSRSETNEIIGQIIVLLAWYQPRH
ncbi:hypothetical protein TCAL_13694, partial [Tigriopus californicus]